MCRSTVEVDIQLCLIKLGQQKQRYARSSWNLMITQCYISDTIKGGQPTLELYLGHYYPVAD